LRTPRGSDQDQPEPSRRLANVAVGRRQLAPWILTGGVVAFLLTRYSLGDIVREVAQPGAFAVMGKPPAAVKQRPVAARVGDASPGTGPSEIYRAAAGQ
jgi:hypothetical protein